MAEGGYDRAVSEKVAFEVSGLDIEDINEDSDIREDMLALLGEVVFHESILTAGN